MHAERPPRLSDLDLDGNGVVTRLWQGVAGAGGIGIEICEVQLAQPVTARRLRDAWSTRRRMGMRRYNRLTNGFSMKVENLAHAASIQFMHYNFARPHSSPGKNVTRAMAAGVSDRVWPLQEIAALLD
jgi:hypothetical protein